MLANLPTQVSVDAIANMKAKLITRFKSVAEDGGVMELVVWRVPQPVPLTEHGYKNRAVCGVNGVRVQMAASNPHSLRTLSAASVVPFFDVMRIPRDPGHRSALMADGIRP